MYHLFALSYGWTIEETDAVPVPMLYCLMHEIGEMPPQDLIANAQLKAAHEKAAHATHDALGDFEIERGTVKRRSDSDGN